MSQIIMPVNPSSPSTPSVGTITIFPKPDGRLYVKDSTGVEVKMLTDEQVVNNITFSAPLTSTGGNSPVVSLTASTTTTPGFMSAADKAKLDAATSSNINNAIVRRDGVGNISVSSITGTLVGNSTSCNTVPQMTGHVTTNGSSNQTSIADSIITNQMIATNANISLSKLSTNPLDRASHTGTQLASSISDFSSTVLTSLSSSIDNSHIAANANIAITKLATNPLDRSNHTGTQLANSISDFNTAVNTNVSTYLSTGPITNLMLATDANIAISKLAVNPLDRTKHTGTQLANSISDFTTAVGNSLGAGSGLTKVGPILNVGGTPNRIDVNEDSIDISSSYTGQNTIDTLGTITTGTWQANPISLIYGGTGAITPSRAATNLRKIDTATSNFTLTAEHQILLVDSSTSSVTISLPPASSVIRTRYTIKKTSNDSNTITISANNSDLIDGSSSKSISTQYDCLVLISTGTAWYILK